VRRAGEHLYGPTSEGMLSQLIGYTQQLYLSIPSLVGP
jgi:hypothetical protein